MDELTREFVAETRETLEHIGEALVGWEVQPDDGARLEEIFRFVHTVKGSCGFLDLPRIGALAHAAESALSQVRDGTRIIDTALVGAMLAIIDRIAILSDALDSETEVPEIDSDDALIASIDTPAVVLKAAESVAAVKHNRNVRVSVDVLESAMVQVSDLVLARNELARTLRSEDINFRLSAAFERVSGAISDVRETIARTRMQPIDRLFALLPRLVRDTSNAVGKTVQLRIEGSDVEIDREMVEAIKDPLTHIVRNAIDHGLESPQDRKLAGKRETGLLTVVARQSGNQVSITVSDDGRGIDVDRLITKAVAANVITAAKARTLSPEAALNLIFASGISTAASVTEISGRGVGMDIVRSNVERLGGAIALDNQPGRGLSITLRAPLTLSIMNALLVEAGGQVFAMPRAAIDEIVSANSPSIRVEAIAGGHVAVVRGRMLSVVSLAAMLGVRQEPLAHLIIVDPPGGNRFALDVARVRDHEELVVRPTTPHIAALGTYAGQTLPDHGIPVLVVDPAGIAARAGLDNERDHRNAAPVVAVSGVGSLVLFRGLDGVRRAIRARDIIHIADIDADDFVSRGRHCFVKIGAELVTAIVDGELPGEGRIAMLRLEHDGQPICFPVDSVEDLVPIPAIAPVADGIVEGFVMIENKAIELLAWPRTTSVPKIKRRIAG